MTYEEFKEQNDRRIRQYGYYIIIVAVSILATCFLPLVGSSADGEFSFPKSVNEWFVFLGSRLVIGFINITIFYCFMSQAEVNVKDEPKYIEASKMLESVKKPYVKKPRSPKEFKGKQWAVKGSMVFLSSVGATWVFADIILRYDLTQLLVYCATIFMGVVFGYITQRKNEIYWKTEYYDYAKNFVENQANMSKEEENLDGNNI